jgi:hypothetical protein
MSSKKFPQTLTAGVLAVMAWSLGAGVCIAQPPPPPNIQPPLPGSAVPNPAQVPGQQDGVEVLARGPIHEAFAEPVGGVPQAGPVIVKAPPPAVEEMPPDRAPQGDMQWVPGYWGWDDDRKDFIWISGIWRQPPPDRQWVPGQWLQVPNGFQWSPGMWTPIAQKQMDYLPPPPAPLEAAASVPAPTPTSIFIPGTWYFLQTRYVWRPGYWMEPRVGWVWVPAHFVWTPAGFVFLEGHWDLDLVSRGMLFAPVYFTAPIYRRPAWFYRPAFVVQTDFVLGALFIRPGFNSYFFGDFFDVAYRRRGFVSFVDFRVGRVGVDPLFGYYRWTNRATPHWENDLRGVYTARFNNVAVRPPQTLVQQNVVVNNVTINKNITNVYAKNTAVVSLNQINQHGTAKIQPVPPQRVAAEQLQVKHLQATGAERVKAEQSVVVKGKAPLRVNDAPHSIKYTMPPAHPAVTAQSKIVAPPIPTGSKPVQHTDPPKGPGRGNQSLNYPLSNGLQINSPQSNIGLNTGTSGAGTKQSGQPGVGVGTNQPTNVNALKQATNNSAGVGVKQYTQPGAVVSPNPPVTSTSLKPAYNNPMPSLGARGSAPVLLPGPQKPLAAPAAQKKDDKSDKK